MTKIKIPKIETPEEREKKELLEAIAEAQEEIKKLNKDFNPKHDFAKKLKGEEEV